jgi:hypothetical protein
MSWLEDFSDGEAVWERLLEAPTLDAWLEEERRLSEREVRLVVLYHAIVAKQAAGEWKKWAGANDA